MSASGNGPRQAAASELRALIEGNLKSLGVDRLDLVYLRIGLLTPKTFSVPPHGESLAERFAVLAALRGGEHGSPFDRADRGRSRRAGARRSMIPAHGAAARAPTLTGGALRSRDPAN